MHALNAAAETSIRSVPVGLEISTTNGSGEPLMENEEAAALRRRIELYRRPLHEGVEGPRLFIYLRQIADDEDALAKLTGGAEQADPDPSPAEE